MLRLFLAIDLPAAVKAEVRAICKALPAAHWTNPAQLHLTLRFMGETPEDQLEALRARLAAVVVAPFSLSLRAVGVFPARPSRRRPARVLWAGVAPEEPACALKAAIDAALGPDPEASARGYSPHLTLARFRDDPRTELDRYLAAHAAFASAPWPVESFELYRSTLGREGAVHERVQSYPLSGR
jgi:2'-5' RNA ligase